MVGLISDTHGLLRPEAVDALRGSDLIVHAGDVGAPEVLQALGTLAPVIAVRGNNDRGRWAMALPEVATARVGGIRLAVIHDVKTFRAGRDAREVDVLVVGHSHRPSAARRDGTLVVNPGSAGPRRFSLPVTVARLHVSAHGIRADVVDLGDPRRRTGSAREAARRSAR